MSIADFVLKEMKKDYTQQLNSQGIPLDPTQRTQNQQELAGMIQAFIASSIKLLVDNLAQGALDNA